ncbi:hypothetical protein PLICRDRAFT_31542 [Plicaturopsis crispa FD-325 SS-3]|nr:hypothetical protein PLICRDRAFT_31542 [Plicaturopsis crispa FD-325 SS-3]
MAFLCFHGRRCSIAVVFAFLCCAFVQADNLNVTVTATDPRIDYTGPWVVQDNGGHTFAGNTSCSMSFSFQGSAIAYHSAHNPNGGVAQLSVDGDNVAVVDESTGTTKGANSTPAVLYSQGGLDASKTHTLTLQWIGPGSLGGGYVELYSLEYTPASASSSAASSQSTTTTTAVHSHTGAIAGGVVGGVAAVIIALVLAWFLWRRRQQHEYEHKDDFEVNAPFTMQGSSVVVSRPYVPTSSPSTAVSIPNASVNNNSVSYLSSYSAATPRGADESSYGASPTTTATSAPSVHVPRNSSQSSPVASSVNSSHLAARNVGFSSTLSDIGDADVDPPPRYSEPSRTQGLPAPPTSHPGPESHQNTPFS